MNIDWSKYFYSGWRQMIGLFLIAVGGVGATFYYQETSIVDSINTTESTPRQSEQLAVSIQTVIPTSVVESASPKVTALPSVSGKIKLSTATQAELESLPKIGPVKAKAIIEYRQKYGFKSLNDLQKVKGIGPKTLEQLKPLVEL